MLPRIAREGEHSTSTMILNFVLRLINIKCCETEEWRTKSLEITSFVPFYYPRNLRLSLLKRDQTCVRDYSIKNTFN